MRLEVVPQAFLPVLCRLAGSRVSPPLESLGEQQPLRESLVILSGQGPCEQKPSLANCRFHTLAPGFLEGFSVRHLSVCAVNAVVPDDPQKELRKFIRPLARRILLVKKVPGRILRF